VQTVLGVYKTWIDCTRVGNTAPMQKVWKDDHRFTGINPGSQMNARDGYYRTIYTYPDHRWMQEIEKHSSGSSYKFALGINNYKWSATIFEISQVQMVYGRVVHYNSTKNRVCIVICKK